jgi:hypothetical protein
VITPLGWLFLVGSVSFVTGLTGWCYWKVLTTPDEHTVKPPDSLGG